MKFSLPIAVSSLGCLSCLCFVLYLPSMSIGQFCNGPRRGYINDTSGTVTNHDDYITVGFLFPFHGPGADGSVCSSTIPDLQTIQLLEMARYTLWFGSITGVRIALEAFDSCYSGQVAVEQSVRYLNDRLQSPSGGSQTCPDGSFKPGMIIHGAGTVGPSVAAFLTDAQVPTVSYAATQSQLTNDDEFLYFARTIPSDRDEAMTITDLLIRMGWTYVSVIHSESQDHVSSMESFKTAATRSNICISKTASFATDATSLEIGNAVLSLIVLPDTPNVVVIFANTSQTQQMFLYASNGQVNPKAGQIQWILGQHAMSDTSYLDSAPATLTTTRGILGVIPDELVNAPQHSFLQFFKMQTPDTVNPSENPWFKEFWQEAYQCNLDGGTKYPVTCSNTHVTQHQTRAELFPQTGLLQDAINNFLNGLNTAQRAKCGSGTSGLCDDFRSMTENELLGFIKGAAYKPNGDPAASKFAIQNYKMGTNGFYSMETVGSWEEGSVGLTLNPSDLELWSNNNREPVSSKCGSDCYDESCILAANVTRVYRNGEIILGGMFSVHQPNGDQCGEINENGIQRLEAMLFALDKLNQDQSVLPGITVGIDGFDTCGVPTIAGHLALQLSASADFGKSGSGERRGQNGISEHIYAIIGPETDDESEIVTQITSVYELPIVGFSADSAVLSNLYDYPNLARVIPPAQTQGSAMVEMMFRQGWRYMHVLHTDSKFGLYAANTIESVGRSRDICATNKLPVPADNSETEWDKIFHKLDMRTDARVLVLFLELQDIKNLFTQLVNRRRVGQYFLVSSDRWPILDHEDLLNDFPQLVKGLTVVTTPIRMFDEFKNYFVNLRPDSNIRNPWFKEYWQNKFQCSLDGDGTSCSASNRVQPSELSDKHLADVVDAVYAVGHGLQTLQQILCPGQSHVCIEMTRSPGKDLWKYIVQQRFSSINQDRHQVAFNSLGDAAPVYDLLNYQSAVNGGQFEFVKIGHFANYAYVGGIDNNRLKVYDENGNEIIGPESVCEGQCHDCKRVDEGNTAEIKDGDVWLGGFFRLHGIGPDKLTCNDEVVLHNMQLLEAFLFAIDSINNDQRVLPNIKVGAIGFDTCGSSTRAQREAGNFITAVVEYRGGYFNNRLTVSAIIGEETSDTTLALADIVTPLKVSQISYAATTTKLDDREKYPYFMRTVASDKHQAEAMVAILDKFNWKYVSVVYSDNEYGNDMYENIKNETRKKGICISLAFKVLDSFVDDDFSAMVKELRLNPQAKVVVLLTSSIDTKALLRQAESLQVVDLQWVGGETWGKSQEMIEAAPLTSLGSIVLQFHSRSVPGFRDYFTNRPIFTNLRNPWWKQYISDLFQCNLPVLDVPSKYADQCPWSFDFDQVYEEVPEVEYIVTAVNMFAVGLEFAMLELCPNITSYVCKEVYEHPELLNKHIRQAGFMHTDGSIFQFDELGNGPATYNILNIQPSQDNFASYVQVGKWDSGTYNEHSQVQLYNGNTPISLFQTQCQGRCNECIDESNKNIEFITVPGHIQIPALFAVHESGDHRVECGSIRDSGVINLEAFLYAIDLINADSSLLSNVKVGTTAFDTCMSSARGVRELSGLLSGVMSYDANDKEVVGSFSTIAGVVGADTPDVTRDTAAVTGQYKYAQVNYGLDSEIASNDPYLLHAGPSYISQAQGVLSLISNYQWQYISVVQGDGTAYFQGAADFIRSTLLDDICVATHQTIQNDRGNMAAIVSELFSAANLGAKVVVVFASPTEIKSLVTEVGNRGGSTNPHLTWILALSENINEPDFLQGLSDDTILQGALSIFPSELNLPAEFKQRLRQLSQVDSINPWSKETSPINDKTILEYGQKAMYVIDATYAIAHGINYLLNRKCPGGDICSAFLQADPVEFYQAIAGVSFNGPNSYRISFSDGSLVRNYKVANFQKSGNGLDYVEVGTWKSGDYQPILANSVRLFDGINEVDNVLSTCLSSSSVCDICAQPPTGGLPPTRPPVPPQETQAPCKNGNKFGKQIGVGVGAPSSGFGSLWFIILIIICAIGIIVTLIVIGLLIWRWDEPITRTLSPFLCLVILIGIILLYGVTPIYAVPVSNIICGLQRVYPGIAWAVCLSGVFLQVMRHFRIGRRERRIAGAKVSFVNNTSQVVLFLFLFAFQVIIAIEWLIIQPPSLVLKPNDSISVSATPAPTKEPIIECAYTNQDMVAYGLFIYFLLILTLFVSIVARRYGHVISVMELNTLLICNFVNIVVIAIWAAVELLYGDYHRPATCAAAAVIATATLIILFTYRVRVLFRNHDPFVDTASVASGEYFTGTLNRMPGEIRNAERRTTDHINDQPPGVEYGRMDKLPQRNGATASYIGSTSSLEKPYRHDTTGL